jgi:hypothetical protein
MRYEYITGLDDEKLAKLVDYVTWATSEKTKNRRGRKQALSVKRQCLMTLIMLRHNLTEQMVACLFAVSQPTVSRIKNKVEPLLAQACRSSRTPLRAIVTQHYLAVDGTYVPTGNRGQTGRTNYSGKRHCQCLNIQVACTLDGILADVSEPVAGARHDSAALKLTGWQKQLATANWIADTAYIGTGARTPKRKPRGRPLTGKDKKINKAISLARTVVERCIAHLKNWKILKTGYRRQLKRLPAVINLVTCLELFRLRK